MNIALSHKHLVAGSAAFASLCLCGSAFAQSTSFGSNNDDLGGFNQSTTLGTQTWTTNADNVAYRNENNGNVNASFLRQYSLTRQDGYAYTVEGTLRLVEGYADDNNRTGIYLFGTAGDLGVFPNENEVGAVGLMFNFDDGSTGGPPGDNSDDNLNLFEGIDNGQLTTTGATPRDETDTAYAQDLFGTSMTFAADIAFVGTDIEVTGRLTDFNGNVTTTETVTLAAADFTGDYFGFASRNRARNYDGSPGTPGGRDLPFEVEYQNFSVTQTAVPEPATYALMFGGAAGLAVLLRRRRRA